MRNSASGLFAAWRLAFARIFANVSSFVPYLLHVREAGAAEVAERERHVSACRPASSVIASKRSNGRRTVGEREAERARLHLLEADASAQSTAPLATAWRARNSAVEPVEQLLLTLTTGMPVMPTS